MKNSTHLESLISGIGGFVAIFAVFWITDYFEQSFKLPLLFVASMGASAVLLFATPMSSFSQPWNIIGGHMVSAFVGVSFHLLVADAMLASALAVGVAIIAMHYLQCIHPPGGATAIIGAMGGAAVEGFGYMFVLFPIALGAIAMTIIAVIYNYPFSWRRYPTRQKIQRSDHE